MSYTRIAAVVGLSEAAVRSRVQRLIEGNVVQIVGVTDPLRLGFRRQAMVGVKTEGDIEAIADTLAAIPEVDYVVFVSGSYDLHLRDRVRERRASPVDPQRQDPERSPEFAPPRPTPICDCTSRRTPGGHVDGRDCTLLTVGVPREVKTEEHRVAITPDGVAEMTHRAVPVLIEHDAGVDSGISDDDYRAAGAEIVARRGGGVGTRRDSC